MFKKAISTILVIAILGSLFYVGAEYIVNRMNSEKKETIPQIENKEATSTKQSGDAQGIYVIEEIATGLFVPWSIVFTAQNRILFTERNGKLREIKDGKLSVAPIHTFTEVSTTAEEGLMGLTLDPEYQSNNLIYLCLAYTKNKTLYDKVVRAREMGNSLSEITTILDNIPAAKFHAGCALKFGPDKKLYITTGDATDKKLPQNTTSLGGKILRINTDGSIPPDNPFPNSAVYSYGHRNPQGIDYDTKGNLYASEHGPSGFDGLPGGDEINLIKKGGNYGWPIVSHTRTASGYISPLTTYTPALAPASALIYKGKIFNELQGNLLFGGLNGERIVRVILDSNNPSKVIRSERLNIPALGRIRAVVEGPDGYIYFSTSNRDGRGKPKKNDDKIYRLKRGE